MSLTLQEKAAGREFLAAEASQLALIWSAEPDAACVPPYLHNYRHDCPARGGQSWSLELHEVYRESPEWFVYKNAQGLEARYMPHSGREADAVVPSGRFAFIYQEGLCPDCRLQVRSGTGRLVDAHERPARERKVHA